MSGPRRFPARPPRHLRRTTAPRHCARRPASAPEFLPTAVQAGSRSRRLTPTLEPRRARRLGEIADTSDISLALGDADYAAGLQSVEDVARLYGLLISGDGEARAEALLAFRGGLLEQV